MATKNLQKMNNQICIVIADDHPIFRSGLSQLLNLEENIEIVGEAENGEKALAMIRETLPEVAVLDIDMPEKGGFEVATELKSEKISTEIIFLTMHKNETLFNAAVHLGVKGFVLKDSAMEDIVHAVKTVSKGESFFSQPLTKFLLKRPKPSVTDLLTPSEKRILSLIGEYKTSREIAEKLFISVRTVERHRENISLKLDLHGNKALLKFALENKSSE